MSYVHFVDLSLRKLSVLYRDLLNDNIEFTQCNASNDISLFIFLATRFAGGLFGRRVLQVRAN